MPSGMDKPTSRWKTQPRTQHPWDICSSLPEKTKPRSLLPEPARSDLCSKQHDSHGNHRINWCWELVFPPVSSLVWRHRTAILLGQARHTTGCCKGHGGDLIKADTSFLPSSSSSSSSGRIEQRILVICSCIILAVSIPAEEREQRRSDESRVTILQVTPGCIPAAPSSHPSPLVLLWRCWTQFGAGDKNIPTRATREPP